MSGGVGLRVSSSVSGRVSWRVSRDEWWGQLESEAEMSGGVSWRVCRGEWWG